MALQVNELKRVFRYKGTELQDIPGASLREVAKAYSGTYPELINSTPNFKEIKDNTEVYEFSGKTGLKG